MNYSLVHRSSQVVTMECIGSEPTEEYRGILDACMHARMHARIYIAATAILSLQRTRVFSYLDLHICVRVRKL